MFFKGNEKNAAVESTAELVEATPRANKFWKRAGLAMAGALAFAGAGAAMAATGGGAQGGGDGDILESVYDMLEAAMAGSVGKVLTVLLIIVGVGAGVARQSLMTFAVGVGAGIGLYFAPTVIDALFSATVIPDAVAQAGGLIGG